MMKYVLATLGFMYAALAVDQGSILLGVCAGVSLLLIFAEFAEKDSHECPAPERPTGFYWVKNYGDNQDWQIVKLYPDHKVTFRVGPRVPDYLGDAE
jgi:hypothetical protein